MKVTEKWFAEMQKRGLISGPHDSPPEGGSIPVHVFDSDADAARALDPDGFAGLPNAGQPVHRIEHWSVGEQVSKEVVEQRLDTASGALYAIRSTRDGQRVTMVLAKPLWDQLTSQLGEI